jgi:hypothetical protein
MTEVIPSTAAATVIPIVKGSLKDIIIINNTFFDSVD